MKFKFSFNQSQYLGWISSYYNILCKGGMYVLVFLLPIFFLPWTLNIIDFNKQALLVFLSFIALCAWMIDVLLKGKVNFYLTYFYTPLAVLLLAVFASSITSLWSYGSFWGWPLASNESFLTVLCLVLAFFLIANIFERKDLFLLFFSFLASWFLVLVYSVLQIFGKFAINFDFTKIASFNTVGTIYSIGIFTASTIPLAMFLMINSKKMQRVFFTAYLILAAFFMLLVNFSGGWITLIASSSLIIIFGTYKKDLFDTRWLVLPMFFLAISLLFLIFQFKISGLPSANQEVFLRQKISLDIALKSVQESPILGSGPGTFSYVFSKFKPQTINQSDFWNVRFENSSSKILNLLTTTGVAGIIAHFLLYGFAVLYGIKFLLRKEKKKEDIKYDVLSVGLFVGILSCIVGFFLYSSNLTLDFAFMFFLAGFVVLNFGEKKEIVLKPSSLITLAATFLFTLLFIFSLGIGILEGQRYYAEAKYFSSLKNMQSGKTITAINDLEKAVILTSGKSGNDIYLRQLSQMYLSRMAEELARTDIAKEQASNNAQLLISNSINAAKMASDLNPKNVNNWDNLGAIYQSISGVIADSEDWAVKSYEEAIKLEPANPYLFVQKGASLLRKAELMTKDQADAKEKALNEAEIQLQKALELKPNYYLPHLYLSSLYQIAGKEDLAIKEMSSAKDATFSQDYSVVFQLGLLYYRYKDYEKASNEFELAVALNPSYSNALYFSGLAFDILGQKQKAIDRMAKVLELNPNNGDVKKIIENLKAGRRALDGLSAEQPSAVPEETKEPEKLKK